MDRKSTDTLEDLLLYFTFYFGRRRLNVNKEAVYRFMLEKFENEAGRKVTFDTVDAGLSKAGYCVVGDLENARNIYIAPLDTSKRTYYPGYRLYPFNEKKKKQTDLAAWCFDSAILAVIAITIYLILRYFGVNRLITVAIVILFAIFFNYLLNNKFTFNRSSAVALLSYLIINDDGHNVYVFVDKCAESFLGLKLFLIKNKQNLERAKKVCYFDCLAAGEYLVEASLSEYKGESPFKSLETEQLKFDEATAPLVFQNCSKLVMLMGCDRDEKGEYYVKNIKTVKDKKVDVVRLKKIAEAIR